VHQALTLASATLSLLHQRFLSSVLSADSRSLDTVQVEVISEVKELESVAVVGLSMVSMRVLGRAHTSRDTFGVEGGGSISI